MRSHWTERSSMTTRISSSIYEDCFAHLAGDAKILAVINSIPVPYFCDVSGYLDSSFLIITVGLNPSDREFEEDKHRFNVSARTPDALEQTLCEYFRKNAYSWFNSFETIL